MGEKVHKGARIPADLADGIEQYAEMRDISESDAMRRLLLNGLRHYKQYEQIEQQLDEIDDRLDTIEQQSGRLL